MKKKTSLATWLVSFLNFNSQLQPQKRNVDNPFEVKVLFWIWDWVLKFEFEFEVNSVNWHIPIFLSGYFLALNQLVKKNVFGCSKQSLNQIYLCISSIIFSHY